MSDILIKSSELSGTVYVPRSKSLLHRVMIASFLANGNTSSYAHYRNECDDAQTTFDALNALSFYSQGSTVSIDFNDSAATARMLLPVLGALGIHAEMHASDMLAARPISGLMASLEKNGVSFSSYSFPSTISGVLHGGTYHIDGNISSQYISGLLLALPMLEKTSIIDISGDISSKRYIDMTLYVMNAFGVHVEEIKTGYLVPGDQRYVAPKHFLQIDGDWSAAAFFFAANALGADICIKGLESGTYQPDEVISILLPSNEKYPYLPKISINQFPDCFPALAAYATISPYVSVFTGINRLRMKESDRIKAMCEIMEELKRDFSVECDTITIFPKTCVPVPSKIIVDSYGDHRIAMAAAIIACYSGCTQTIIQNADCVSKSYPDFFSDLQKLGANIENI